MEEMGEGGRERDMRNRVGQSQGAGAEGAEARRGAVAELSRSRRGAGAEQARRCHRAGAESRRGA